MPRSPSASENTKVATIQGNSIRILGPGTAVIDVYPADGNPNQARKSVLVVAGNDQTIDFPALALRLKTDTDFVPRASASSGRPLVFTSSNLSVATIVGGKVHPVGPGTTIIRASQPGGTGYFPVTAERTLLVLPFAAPGGSGTAADPFRISSYDDLLWLSLDSTAWKSNFIQTADIDASPSRRGAVGIPGIGSSSTPFEGSYVGLGHFVKHAFVQAARPSDADPQGLFSVVGPSGRVVHLGLEDFDVWGASRGAGGLVGRNSGLIDSCITDAWVVSSEFAGGLVGDNRGTVRRSASTGEVDLEPSGTGSGIAGGLAGANTGAIEDCYSTATLESPSVAVASLVGVNTGRVSRSYAIAGDSPNASGVAPGATDSCHWYRTNIPPGPPPDRFLSLDGMSDSVSMSDVVGGSGNWIGHWGSAPPTLAGIENPPYALPDSLAVPDSFPTARLLANDGAASADRSRLVAHVDSLLDGASLESATVVRLPPAANMANSPRLFHVRYRIGRVRDAGDTLWGNRVWSVLRRNGAPKIVVSDLVVGEDATFRGIFATDPEGDSLRPSVVVAPTRGLVSFRNDTLVFAPSPDSSGSDSLQVAVSDGVTRVPGWIHILIQAVNDPPVVQDLRDSTTEGVRRTVTLSGIDRDGRTVSFLVVKDPLHGMSRIQGNLLTYAPDAGFTGMDTLSWEAMDDSGAASRPAKLILKVRPGTTSLHPRSASGNSGISLRVGPRLVEQSRSGREPGRLGTGPATCASEAGCQSLSVLLPGPGTLRVEIVDNLGVPVISLERDLSAGDLALLPREPDGRSRVDLRWNLRATGGEPVASGVYLWVVEASSGSGQNLKEIHRLGVRSSP